MDTLYNIDYNMSLKDFAAHNHAVLRSIFGSIIPANSHNGELYDGEYDSFIKTEYEAHVLAN